MLQIIFTMSNNVQVNINGVNQKLMEIYASIRIEKDKNKELKRQLGIVSVTCLISFLISAST